MLRRLPAECPQHRSPHARVRPLGPVALWPRWRADDPDRGDLDVLASRSGPAQAAPAAGQTLAILPFKPLLPAERNESLELGMTESLISSLGQQVARAIAR